MARPVCRMRLRLFAIGAALILPTGLAGQSGGDGTIYMATYDHAVYAVDESTLEIRSRIPLESGIPINLQLSSDRSRLYVIDATREYIETIDLEAYRERLKDNQSPTYRVMGKIAAEAKRSPRRIVFPEGEASKS